MTTHSEIPIACDLTALPADVREKHLTEGMRILQAAQEVLELPNGYAFRFANEPGTFMAIANFVEHERRCCPFYAFVIEMEPGSGPLWLRLTGGEGVKEFEAAIFGNANEALRTQLINTGNDAALHAAVIESAAALADRMTKAAR